MESCPASWPSKLVNVGFGGRTCLKRQDGKRLRKTPDIDFWYTHALHMHVLKRPYVPPHVDTQSENREVKTGVLSHRMRRDFLKGWRAASLSKERLGRAERWWEEGSWKSKGVRRLGRLNVNVLGRSWIIFLVASI